MNSNHILVDGRWQGQHGIGRFSTEIISRLQHADIFSNGPHPLAMPNLIWQSYRLARSQAYKVFFTPGFNPVLYSRIPYVFTLHDLIHIQFPGKAQQLKKLFYALCVKPSAKRAYKIATISEYSRQRVMEWAGLAPDNVIDVGCGISHVFSTLGAHYQPGFPYLLHVGNTRPHKNVERLIAAFARADIDKDIKLICTGQPTARIHAMINQYGLEQRVITHTHLTEERLAEYYRGALGVVFPSLYEGFGLPVAEGMASGVPVLTSDATSLPEVAGEAALLIDPYQIDSIAEGITKLVNATDLRHKMISAGIERAKLFSWDATAQRVQTILNQFL